jgi:hypothetical protein
MILPTNISLKLSYRIFIIAVILFIVIAYVLKEDYFDLYLNTETFNNLRKYFLFNNLQNNKYNNTNNCQSRLLNLQHSIGRNNKLNNGIFTHLDSNYLSNDDLSLSVDKLHDLNVRQLGYINRMVQIKYGSLYLVAGNEDNLYFKNIILDGNNYKASTFKIVLGLADPKCVSLYHLESDRYICRKPDGSLFLAYYDLIDCNARNSFSFKIARGLINGNKVVISCPRIGKELRGRILYVSKNLNGINIPRMNPLNEVDNISKCEITFIDCHSGIQLGTKYEGLDLDNKNSKLNRQELASGLPADEQQPYGLHLPKFFNNSSCDYASNKEGFQTSNLMKKSKLRSSVSSLCKEGEYKLTNNNSLCKEIFPEDYKILEQFSTHTHHQKEAFLNNVSSDANAENNVQTVLKPSNVFGKITGGDAEKLLNKYTDDKNYSDILSDGLMEKLQEAKLDPNVQNLLDYNEKLFNVYQNENREYLDKLEKQSENHIDDVDYRIRQANNYRINQMAKQLFNAENILREKQLNII